MTNSQKKIESILKFQIHSYCPIFSENMIHAYVIYTDLSRNLHFHFFTVFSALFQAVQALNPWNWLKSWPIHEKNKDNWRSEGSACATEVSPKTWFMLMLFTLTYQGNIIFTFALFFPHYSRPSKPKSHATDKFWNKAKLISKSHSLITQPLTYDKDQAIYLSSAPNTFRNSPVPHNLHLCFHPPPPAFHHVSLRWPLFLVMERWNSRK